MTPEDGMRLLNDPDEWNLTLRPRADAFPKRRAVSPLVVSFATIAAVAVIGIILFSVFGLSIQNVRQPVRPPAVPTSDPSGRSTPTPTATPTAAAGAVTCESLLDAKTVADLKAAGSEVTDDSYTKKVVDEDAQAGGTRIGLATFVKYGGIICGWGGSELSFMYGYGPITPEQEADAKSRLSKKGFTTPDGWGYERYENGPQAFAFGDGYWAYSYNNGGGDKLSEVVTHGQGFVVPPASTAAAIPAKAPYLTSEGLGDLRLGSAIPASSRFAQFIKGGCTSKGAWYAKSPYDNALTIRALGKAGKLEFIVLRTPTIPTKSGIRVGSTEASLLATYSHFDKKPSGDSGMYEIDGTAGKVVFEVTGGTVVAIGTVPRDAHVGSFVSGDSWGSCVA